MWPKLTQVFKLGGQWGNSTVRLIDGNDAVATLKRVETILESAMTALRSHQDLLSETQYKAFTIKHRRLLLKVLEVQQDIRQRENRAILSATPTDRHSYDTEVAQLCGEVEIYHRDVVSASRRGQEEEDMRFNQRYGIDPNSQQIQQAANFNTTVYSIVTSPGDSSSGTPVYNARTLAIIQPPPPSLDAVSETSTLVDRESLVAIAHIPERPLEGEGSAQDPVYRRIFILEDPFSKKNVVMVDPNLCSLDKDSESFNGVPLLPPLLRMFLTPMITENTLLEMGRAGEALLRANGPDNLTGCEVIRKSEEGQEYEEWLNSFYMKFMRWSMGLPEGMM
ncbi:hypothetical protein CTheo_7720 [Ceratobasidium theobromae]|uniref:Uncharacterized protein n=1 Tax=Ceratobasidium theobromae TaxID=1582974 RepID=A0A5N5QBG0_9AGAM|nr:hypothetical protein CTheo_7720 [Ceratobasidium theobromae]